MANDPLVEARKVLAASETSEDPIAQAKRVLAEFNLPEGGTPEYQQGVAEVLAPLQEKVAQGAGLSVREGEPTEKVAVEAWREAANRPLLGKPVGEILTDIPRNAVTEAQGLASNVLTAGTSMARMAGSMHDLVQAAVTTPDTGWEAAQKAARRKKRKENWDEFAAAAEGGGLLPLSFLGGPLGAVAGRLGPVAGAIASRIPALVATAPTVVPTVKFIGELAENPVETAVQNPLGTLMLGLGGRQAVKAVPKVLTGKYQPKTRTTPATDDPSWYVRNPSDQIAQVKGRPVEAPLSQVIENPPVPKTAAEAVKQFGFDTLLTKASDFMKDTPVAEVLSKRIGKSQKLTEDSQPSAVRDIASKGVEKLFEKFPALESWTPGIGERQAFVNQAVRAGLSPKRIADLLKDVEKSASTAVREGMMAMETPEIAAAVQDVVKTAAPKKEFRVSYGTTEIPMRDILSNDEALATRSAGGLIRAVTKSREPGGLELAVELPWDSGEPLIRARATQYVSQAVPTVVKSILDTVSDPAEQNLRVRAAMKRIAEPDLSGKRESYKGQNALVHTYKVLSEANAAAAQAGALESILKQVPDVAESVTKDFNAAMQRRIETMQWLRATDAKLGGRRIEASGEVPASTLKIPSRKVDLDKLNTAARTVVERVLKDNPDVPEPIARFIEQAGKKESSVLKALADTKLVSGMGKAMSGAMTILGHTAIKANPPTRIFNGISNYSIGEWLAASTGIPSPMVHPVKWMAKSKEYIDDLYAGRLGAGVGKDPGTGKMMRLGEIVADLGGDPVALAELRLTRGSNKRLSPAEAVAASMETDASYESINAVEPQGGAPARMGRFAGTLHEGAARAADAKAAREAAVLKPIEEKRANIQRVEKEIEPETTRVENILGTTKDVAAQRAKAEAALKVHAENTRRIRREIEEVSDLLTEMESKGDTRPEIRERLSALREQEGMLREQGSALHDTLRDLDNNAERYASEHADATEKLNAKKAQLLSDRAALAEMEKLAREGGISKVISRAGDVVGSYWSAYRDVPNATYSQGYFSDFAHRIPAIKFLMEKGYPYKAALSIVKDAYLDYGKNGKAVQTLSAIAMPFFGFSAAAFPKQVSYMINHPLRALVWMQAGDAAHRAWAMALDIDETERKKMLRDTPATPVYRSADGKLHTLDTTRGGTKTAIQEGLGALVKPGGGVGEAVKTMARGNPLLPAISQAFTGNDPRTGRSSVGTLERVWDPVKTFAVPPYFRTLVGDVLWQRRPDSKDKESRVLAPERIAPSGEKVPFLADVGQAIVGLRTREYDRDKRVGMQAFGKAAELKGTQRVYTELGELTKRIREAINQKRFGKAEELKAQARKLAREIGADINEIMSQ